MKYLQVFLHLAKADNLSAYVARDFNTSLVYNLIRCMSLLIVSLKIGGMHHIIADRTLDIHLVSLLTMLVIHMASHGRYLHDFSTNSARRLNIMDLLLVASKKMLEHDFMANITFNLVFTNCNTSG
jgi:hypothetical protein